MTEQQINAAIDKIKGLSDYECRCESCHPDWCNDLNAMHEAEKVLTDTNMFVMAHHIERLVSAKGQHYFHATARQRAEAFLRTLGKWEEAQG
jgi:hypothetical protein